MLKSIASKLRRQQFIISSALLIFLVVLLSMILDCSAIFSIEWKSTNSIFSIDNTNHVFDVKNGTLDGIYDQVQIICPFYKEDTFENETEQYVIYLVNKDEYETCNVRNDPKIVAMCNQPYKYTYYTITFRPFSFEGEGYAYQAANDYHYISTSSKHNLQQHNGGACLTDGMKVMFKICCEEKKPVYSWSIEKLKEISEAAIGLFIMAIFVTLHITLK